MANKLIILTEDYLQNVLIALGELPAKFSHAILVEIETQTQKADLDLKAHIESIEAHLKPLKVALESQHAE